MDIQDQNIPTSERYEAIAKLYKFRKNSDSEFSQIKLANEINVANSFIANALDYVGFKEEEPELVKGVAGSIVSETRNLPKKERKEILQELKSKKEEGKKIGTVTAIRELVKAKKEKVETKKIL